MSAISEQNDEQQAIVIDGQTHTLDDLTFREQHKLRTAVRQLSGDPEMLPGDASLMDFLPALAYVIKGRSDPEFTLEQALDMRMDEVISDRPTEADGKTSKRAGSGSRGSS